jgi:hypothetical protein
MAYLILASRDDTNVALSLSVSPATPVATSATVAIRDEDSAQAPAPLYLDFFDSTFKTVGWVTQFAALINVRSNYWALDGGVDFSAFTNLPATTDQLAAEYEAVVGGITLTDIDHIEIGQNMTQVHVGWARRDAANVEVTISAKWRGEDIALTAATIEYFNSDGGSRFIPVTAGPDGQGLFRGTAINTLVAQASYWRATVTTAQGDITTVGHVPFTF